MADHHPQPLGSRGYAADQTASSRDSDEDRRRHKETRSRSDRKGSRHDQRSRKRHHRRRRHRQDDSSSSSDSSSHHRKRKRSRKMEKERYDNGDSNEDRRRESRSRKRRRRDVEHHVMPRGPDGQPPQEEAIGRENNREGSLTGESRQIPERRPGVPMFLPQRGERPRLNLALKRKRRGVIVAQAMKAKGPDGTVGFVAGWTSRKSRFTEL